MEGNFTIDIIAVILSTLALLFSIVQFSRDSLRQQKESTLNAYNALQYDAFEKLNKYVDMSTIEYQSDAWEEITICLAQIENFSVGINTGIYSLKILNRLGGAFFIRQFEKLTPVINLKREKNVSPGSHYDEFEKTVEMLRKRR